MSHHKRDPGRRFPGRERHLQEQSGAQGRHLGAEIYFLGGQASAGQGVDRCLPGAGEDVGMFYKGKGEHLKGADDRWSDAVDVYQTMLGSNRTHCRVELDSRIPHSAIFYPRPSEPLSRFEQALRCNDSSYASGAFIQHSDSDVSLIYPIAWRRVKLRGFGRGCLKTFYLILVRRWVL